MTPSRPRSRVTLHAGTPTHVRREVDALLATAVASDQVSVIISITPAVKPAVATRDLRGAPSRPGPPDPTNP